LPEPGGEIELSIVNDGRQYSVRPGFYLFGDNVRYQPLFDHWTVAAIRRGRQLRPYRLDFKTLAAAANVADKVAGGGWQYAAFVAKLMTSSKRAMEAYETWMQIPVEERSKNPELRRVVEPEPDFQRNMFQAFPEESSDTWDEVRRVVRRHVSFESRLFVVKRMSKVHERSPKIPELPDREYEYRVAGINSGGRKVLQRVRGDRHESYYGYFGEYPKAGKLDPASLNEATWQGFSAMHTMLHQRAVDAIVAGGLDRAIAS
jgi:hypothetical protein